MDLIHDYIGECRIALLSAILPDYYQYVYLPGVLVFLVSPWHAASDAALHEREPLGLCYLYRTPNILLLFDKTNGCFTHDDAVSLDWM